MAKKKPNDTFTVKDFKMWLLGMTEFQESDWTPNAKQWKTILDKVEMLDESVQYVQVETQAQPNRNGTTSPNGPVYQEAQPTPQNPYGFSNFDISQNSGGASPLDANFRPTATGIQEINPGQSFI